MPVDFTKLDASLAALTSANSALQSDKNAAKSTKTFGAAVATFANATDAAIKAVSAAIPDPTPPPTPPPTPTPSSSYFWTATSPINVRLPQTLSVDPNSASMMNHLGSTTGIWPNGQQYAGAGSPTIYDAKNATTTKVFKCLNTGNVITVPWNPSWVPGPTGDMQMCIVDHTTGNGWEFQSLDIPNGQCHDCATYNVLTGNGASNKTHWIAVMPLLAGIILPSDFASGSINHALRCAIDFASSSFDTMASHSDGGTNGGVPSGRQLALPRSVNLAQFGLDKWQTMIAVALQEFGVFVGDSGGGFSISLQSVADGVTTYPATINGLPHSLLSQLVVLHAFTPSS